MEEEGVLVAFSDGIGGLQATTDVDLNPMPTEELARRLGIYAGLMLETEAYLRI